MKFHNIWQFFVSIAASGISYAIHAPILLILQPVFILLYMEWHFQPSILLFHRSNFKEIQTLFWDMDLLFLRIRYQKLLPCSFLSANKTTRKINLIPLYICNSMLWNIIMILVLFVNRTEYETFQSKCMNPLRNSMHIT